MKSMKNTFIIAATTFLAIALSACQSNQTAISEINKLQQQIANDSKELAELESKYYIDLRENYIFCDSMLQYAPKENLEDYFQTLNLAQAYLLQFGETQPIMAKKFDYSKSQLESLKKDIKSNYINDSLANIYLLSEKQAADTLQAQISYFKERLEGQKDALNTLMKTLKQQWKNTRFSYRSFLL